MLNKKLKVILSLFAALTVMTTMCFATDEATLTLTSDEDLVTTETTVEDTSEDIEITADETDATGSEELTGQTQATEGDIYKVAEDIEISEAINGNVFLVGKTVKITGQIAGDLFVIAESLDIDGAQIYGNVFAGAGSINLNGLIYDLYGACKTLTVPYNGTAYRDLKVCCEDATINGVVGGNLKIAVGGTLTLEDDCMVYKNLEYVAPNEIEVKDGLIQGEVKYSAEKTEEKTNNVAAYLMSLACVLVFTLAVWAIFTFLAPKAKEKAVSAGKNKAPISILCGLAGLVAIPFAVAILCVTLIGIPVAITLLVVFGLALSISIPMAVISLADILAKEVPVLAKGKNVLAVLVVAIIAWLLTLIPYINAIVAIAAVLYGFGMLILTIFNKAEKKADKKEKTKKTDKKD